jgi:outer membrane protein assembly factor BamB
MSKNGTKETIWAVAIALGIIGAFVLWNRLDEIFGTPEGFQTVYAAESASVGKRIGLIVFHRTKSYNETSTTKSSKTHTHFQLRLYNEADGKMAEQILLKNYIGLGKQFLWASTAETEIWQALDPATGKLVWSEAELKSRWPEIKTHHQMRLSDGVFYFTLSDGRVVQRDERELTSRRVAQPIASTVGDLNVDYPLSDGHRRKVFAWEKNTIIKSQKDYLEPQFLFGNSTGFLIRHRQSLASGKKTWYTWILANGTEDWTYPADQLFDGRISHFWWVGPNNCWILVGLDSGGGTIRKMNPRTGSPLWATDI